MKSIILKTILIISLSFIYNCKAQTTNDYVTFYNGVASKLNEVAIYKTQFYGQNFSNFYNELLNKNIAIIDISVDAKTDPGTKYYILRLYFSDSNMETIATSNSFRYPWVSITFQNEIPNQIKGMILQYHGEWNNNFVQFFSNLKIESIRFLGINGHNSNDYSAK